MTDTNVSTDVTPNTITPATVTGKGGMKFNMNQSGWSIKASKVVADCTPTKAYICDSSQNVLATANFSGTTATFSPPYALSDATDYFILHDADGSSYVRKYVSVSGYPYSHTELDWIAGKDELSGAVGTGEIFSIEYITLTNVVNATITPDALVISTDVPVVNITIKAKPLFLNGNVVLATPQIILENPNADPSSVLVGTGTKGTRFVTRDYPYTEGLIAGTTRQKGRVSNLVPETSYVRNNRGI